ncbi:MAG: hypothetical protein QOH08_1149 [Chloroflexota bacterium]|nr:hypothetical protein [Chloroflexota bacterium]
MTQRTRVLAGLAIAMALALLYVLRPGTPQGPAALATPTLTSGAVASASPAASPSPTGAPTASPLPPGTFENKVLGYRITLPERYRLGGSRVTPGQPPYLGDDTYTPQTEKQERERCLSDSGDVGFLTYAREDVTVRVLRNLNGLSAEQWAQPLSTHMKVVPTTINGLEAVRLVEDNTRAATMAFVIRVGDRIYHLTPAVGPLEPASLEEIAKTFVAITPAPYPAPTATASPRDSAAQLAARLAAALAAKNADAVAREMADCWLFISPLINGQPAGGVQYRSVALFTDGLRERFAAGDLDVAIDQTLRTNARSPESFFVRSIWKERDRSSVIDLYVHEADGRWIWFSAEPQDGWPCRRPWVSKDSC